MEAWLEWARGPAFRFALIFMILGLLRHLALTVAGIVQAIVRAGDRNIPYRKVLLDTVSWMIPITRIRERFLYSLASVLFHICIILVPLFLAGHVQLWRRGLGIGWPAMNPALADVLTIGAVVTIVCLLAGRLGSQASRELSRPQDIYLPLLIAVPFVSGFLASHPALNPFGFEATLFVHVMSGNIIFLLIPLTKLSHMILLPTTQMVAEVGWHFPAESGKNVGIALGKEGQPV